MHVTHLAAAATARQPVCLGPAALIRPPCDNPADRGAIQVPHPAAPRHPVRWIARRQTRLFSPGSPAASSVYLFSPDFRSRLVYIYNSRLVISHRPFLQRILQNTLARRENSRTALRHKFDTSFSIYIYSPCRVCSPPKSTLKLALFFYFRIW